MPVVCLDADPVNSSLHGIAALKAEPVNLFVDGSDEADLHALDAMMERLLTEKADIVIDNGASSLMALSRYLIQGGVADAIQGAGKKLIVHTLVAGGVELLQTVRGFDSIASQFPQSVDLALGILRRGLWAQIIIIGLGTENRPMNAIATLGTQRGQIPYSL
jgi:hypothetical protein